MGIRRCACLAWSCIRPFVVNLSYGSQRSERTMLFAKGFSVLRARLESGESILDVGCGTGTLAIAAGGPLCLDGPVLTCFNGLVPSNPANNKLKHDGGSTAPSRFSRRINRTAPWFAPRCGPICRFQQAPSRPSVPRASPEVCRSGAPGSSKEPRPSSALPADSSSIPYHSRMSYPSHPMNHSLTHSPKHEAES